MSVTSAFSTISSNMYYMPLERSLNNTSAQQNYDLSVFQIHVQMARILSMEAHLLNCTGATYMKTYLALFSGNNSDY